MLETYIYWFVVIELTLRGLFLLVPKPVELTSTQTSRIIALALWMPVFGRILGWW